MDFLFFFYLEFENDHFFLMSFDEWKLKLWNLNSPYVWRLAEKNNIPLPHEHHVRKDLSS